MKIDTGDKEIDELLTRGVGEFIDPDGTFVKKLKENPEKIVIKFGVDPTRPDIHLGHAVVLKKLRQFQDLGCKVIFLVGDLTAAIGDPTGKSKVRPELDVNQMVNNINSYIKQIPKILKIEPNEEEKNTPVIRDENNFVVDSPWFGWMRNAEWFQNVTDITTEGATNAGLTIKDHVTNQEVNIPANSFLGKAALYENTRLQKMFLKKNEINSVSFISFLSVLRNISFSQLIERDMFQERIKKNEPLFIHEMLYPIIQGIDSSALSKIYTTCDLEVGGTDQTFNMLMGRRIMEISKINPIQAVLSFKLLEGLDGKEKMSKSLDNYIGITDQPNDMYGKVMSIPDTSIINYFELCTNIPLDEIKEIEKSLKGNNINPKDIKMRLAKQIVLEYHGDKAAQEAEDQFEKTFSKGEIPDDVKKIEIKIGSPLVDILIKNGMVESKSEFRRLVEEGAIKFNANMEERKIIDPASLVDSSGTIKIGKKRFIHITVTKN